mmetsp:Transcript_1124/g.3109  ORF Transcript_1124/g.3109 Transcript_1124/m.3109 type:complete len:1078 (-) Transcript_1124:268-3501(-)
MASDQSVKKKYNIRQYRGLVDNVNSIKDAVERDRRDAAAREKSLQERLAKGEAEATTIQKELSVQLRCAGRSYQQLLGATRDLSEQLREEEEQRKREREELERQVKDLKLKLANAAKPWKEEILKRDVRIMKLQEAATDQEGRLREVVQDLNRERERSQGEIQAREEKAEILVKEIDVMREQMAVEAAQAAAELEAEKKRAFKESTALSVELSQLKETVDGIAAPYQKSIKELELKVAGLERQLDDVDYSSYEKKIKQKENGYQRLIRDFGVKQKKNEVTIDKMRISFEDVVKKLDKKIQENEKTYEKKLAPWKEDNAKKQAKLEFLQKQLEEQRLEEAKARKFEKMEREELQKELDAAKAAVDLANRESYKLKAEIERIQEEDDNSLNRRKIWLLEAQLEETTKKCEAMIKSKDKEIREKTELMIKLQTHVVELTEAANRADQEWDKKIQSKEEGYQLVVAQLAYAEGQILEERQRTAAAIATIKRREETIARLENEHAEELRVRLLDRNELLARLLLLDAEIEECHAREERVRRELEARYEAFRKRDERRVADLLVERARVERAKAEVDSELAQVRRDFEKARVCWEDKERDLQIAIRSRDRAVIALKNEIEFLQDSFEIKYNRLMSLFEKLQKKYDELLGPNGVAETFRRARDLKQENGQLMIDIAELKEMIKKQKRQIRDLQLDIDIHMKETAALINRKEMGMAKLVGENAKLETLLREEKDLKERLVKELTQEKKDMVASFQARVDQLEQLVESMRFTDRQELLDKIYVWKRAYERICIERDDIEDENKSLIDVKDMQLKQMAIENIEIKAKVHEETVKGQEALEAADDVWKRKYAKLFMEKEQLEKDLLKLSMEHNMVKMKADKALLRADQRTEDPEKDRLRQKIKEQEEQILAVEAGKQKIIDENTELRTENESVKDQLVAVQDDWEPQIRWRDERYESMMKEYNALKQVLAEEMKKAQDSCKEIEEQVRRFPSPFEQELEELKGKYAQTQAGLLKLSRENLGLREELTDYKEEATKEREQLEEGLRMASHILKEVAGLGALKTMTKAQVASLESALGVDLDRDGRIGSR